MSDWRVGDQVIMMGEGYIIYEITGFADGGRVASLKYRYDTEGPDKWRTLHGWFPITENWTKIDKKPLVKERKGFAKFIHEHTKAA